MFSVASLDQSEFLSDQNFFESMYDQLIKENQELTKNLLEKSYLFDEKNKSDQTLESFPKRKLKLDLSQPRLFKC